MNIALNTAIPGSDSARRLLRVIDAGLENDDEAARHGPPAPIAASSAPSDMRSENRMETRRRRGPSHPP